MQNNNYIEKEECYRSVIIITMSAQESRIEVSSNS